MDCRFLEETQDIHAFFRRARSTGIPDDTSTSQSGKRCVLPPWLDPRAIKVGRTFVAKHFFLVIFTHFLSLIVLMSYVPVRTVLMKTGKSHTKNLSLSRYMSTVCHVKLWYESDLSNAESEAVSDVVKIRKVHAGVSKRMERGSCPANDTVCENDNNSDKAMTLITMLTDLNRDGNNNLQNGLVAACPTDYCRSQPINQLDMIVTQYCFMGLLTTFPQKFGISSKEDMEGLQGFIHIWAVVGYLLGIKDEFNLCIGDKTMEKQYVLNEILLKGLSNLTEDSYKLWDSLVSAMSAFVPFLSIQAELLYILDFIMEFKVPTLFNGVTFNDKVCYKVKVFVITVLCRSSVLRSAFNMYLRLALHIVSLWLGSVKVLKYVWKTKF